MELGDENFTVALFHDFPIRRKWHDGRWFYSIIDIIAAITGSTQPSRYWGNVKARLSQETAESFPNWEKLPFPAADSKMYKTECADRETILRIVQTIPHPNAEPFKLWLAHVGNEALEPESADEHARRLAYRRMLYRIRTGLHEEIKQHGIVLQRQEEEFDDAGYQGLYENMTKADLLFRFGLMPNDEPEDRMVSEELADNIFMDAQTRSLIQRHNITGAQNLNTAHYDVGLETRLTIERLGGTMPENLPAAKRLTQGQYLPKFAHEWEADTTRPALAPGTVYIVVRDGRAIVSKAGIGAATNWEALEIEAMCALKEQGSNLDVSGAYPCPSEIAALATFGDAPDETSSNE